MVARTPSCPRSTACGLTSIQARDTSIRVARREVKRQLAAIPEAEERLILATGRYIGEGFDDARLDTLFLALPVSWKGTLIQYAGRLHRLHPAKQEVRIFDYVDREVQCCCGCSRSAYAAIVVSVTREAQRRLGLGSLGMTSSSNMTRKCCARSRSGTTSSERRQAQEAAYSAPHEGEAHGMIEQATVDAYGNSE